MPFSQHGLLDIPAAATVTKLADPGVTKLQKHKKSTEPLFQRMPSIADVPGPDLSKKVTRDAGLDPALEGFEAAEGIWAVLINDISAKNAKFGKRYLDNCRLIATTIFKDVDDADAQVRRWAAWNIGDAQRGIQGIMPRELMTEAFDKAYRTATSGLDRETAEIVRIWVHASRLLPGAVGTGLYTAPQRDRFARIQRYLATNRPVTATSPKAIPGLARGKGHSAGESMVEGLVAEHVYSIADTKMDAVGAAPLIPVAVEDRAESWIELTDYCRSFQRQESVGAQAHGDARQKLFSNLDQQLQAQRGQLKPVK